MGLGLALNRVNAVVRNGMNDDERQHRGMRECNVRRRVRRAAAVVVGVGVNASGVEVRECNRSTRAAGRKVRARVAARREAAARAGGRR